MNHTLTVRLTPLLVAAAVLAPRALARQATSTVESRTFLTYPYGSPDPVPMLARDARLYPYHAYDGYAVTGRDSVWTTIRLENDHVVAWVLPDVGGKVWGAVEKAGGEEFVYRNEVMKFRNIALRGPWTSGGIEMNFGVIGHAPWTASPVDYVVERREDGSASVVVGAMDVPSRTHWRVRISLPAEGAWLQTDALWYNPTPFGQPYYNWMTAAAFAREDLRIIAPGDRYLRHSGEALPWPVDASGRTLSRYAANTFEGHKSYHVVGIHDDFFGGYYEADDWGFGHWSPYREMPGQKMWLWALSDEGGIWEDLLTDGDGQYVEWQAGRLLVQYSPGGDVNPITQAVFEPGAADRWTERWFPVRGIGGMSDVSERGVLHAVRSGSDLVVGVNAFTRSTDTMEVRVDGTLSDRRPLSLEPLQPVRVVVPVAAGASVRVDLPALGLHFASPRDREPLRRPFRTDPEALASRPEADRLWFEGRELAKARRYAEARATLERALAQDAWHPGVLAAIAELHLRSARFEEALAAANRILQVDAYDAGANWLAGLAHQALGHRTDAEEAFGWAARSLALRAAATTRLAEMALERDDAAEALDLARAAAAYLPDAFGALAVQAVALRTAGRAADARRVLEHLLERDPLHHFARAEAWLAEPSDATREAFVGSVRSELPEQTFLELAVDYVRRGRPGDAERVLSVAPSHPLVSAWRAWILRETDPAAASLLLDAAAAASPGFVFPFRAESLPVLEWAAERRSEWAFRYWLALLYRALDRPGEAATVFRGLGDTPDYGPFYAARAAFSSPGDEAVADVRRSVELDPDTWRLRLLLMDRLSASGRRAEALRVAREASVRFPRVFDVSLALARALTETGAPAEAASIMDTVTVLPSEMGRTSRMLYEWSHMLVALDLAEAGDFVHARREVLASLEWPKRLGQGRPYDRDERVQHGLMAWIHERLGDRDRAVRLADSVLAWTRAHADASPVPAALVHRVLARAGRDADADAIFRAVEADPEAAWAAAMLAGRPDQGASPDAADPGARVLRRALRLTLSTR